MCVWGGWGSKVNAAERGVSGRARRGGVPPVACGRAHLPLSSASFMTPCSHRGDPLPGRCELRADERVCMLIGRKRVLAGLGSVSIGCKLLTSLK